MTLRRIIQIIVFAALAHAAVYAYDLTADNADGRTLYFNLIGTDEVELTYHTRYAGTPSYSGDLDIPETITVEGTSYKVTGIGEYAMFNCRKLISVNIPHTVDNIGMRALAWCDAIQEITLPQDLERIGANAFDGCYALTSIHVDKSNTHYTDMQGVLHTSDLTTLVSYTPGIEGEYTVSPQVTTIGDNAFAGCTFLTSITLPEGLTTIGDNAFYFCNSLSDIAIPSTVSQIGFAALADCINLESIEIAEGNNHYVATGGILFDKDTTILIQSPCALTGMPVIPNSVSTIGENAFLRSHSITTLKLPATVSTIRQSAFIDCMSLRTIEIPSSVTAIEDMAFAMCPILTSIYVDATDPASIDLGESVFAESITGNCTLYVPSQSIDLYARAPQWKDFKHIAASDNLQPQTIVWDDTYDELPTGPMTLGARATSGLDVSYILSLSSLDKAQIDNNTLIVSNPGQITITAYQNGNNRYLPATPVTRILGTPPSYIQDIDGDNGIKVYGSIGTIIISGALDDDEAEVFDIRGVKLYQGTQRTIPVPSGNIYIVRIQSRTYKVAVR